VTQPLMGLAEIRMLFKLSHAATVTLTRRPSFPEPVADLAMGKVWNTYAVQEWAKATGRDTKDSE
jgi:prophage regulatory protein